MAFVPTPIRFILAVRSGTMDAKLGLRENWKQFTLLVIINMFVGGMVGMERTILPQIAEADWQ